MGKKKSNGGLKPKPPPKPEPMTPELVVRTPGAELASPPTSVELIPAFENELASLRTLISSPDATVEKFREKAGTFSIEVEKQCEELHGSWVQSHNQFVDASDELLEQQASPLCEMLMT